MSWMSNILEIRPCMCLQMVSSMFKQRMGTLCWTKLSLQEIQFIKSLTLRVFFSPPLTEKKLILNVQESKESRNLNTSQGDITTAKETWEKLSSTKINLSSKMHVLQD